MHFNRHGQRSPVYCYRLQLPSAISASRDGEEEEVVVMLCMCLRHPIQAIISFLAGIGQRRAHGGGIRTHMAIIGLELQTSDCTHSLDG